MAAGRGRTRRQLDIWPGYVDVLSTLLMVIIFTLMVLVIAQVFLSHALSGRDQALAQLSQKVTELGDLLALEKTTNDKMTQQLASTISDRDAIAAALAAASDKAEVDAKLADAYKLIDADRQKVQTLLGDIAALESLRDDLKQKLGVSQADADAAKKLTSEGELQIELLNRQMTAMRDQLAKLVVALDASETKAKADEVQIIDLAKRHNEALAKLSQKVTELGDMLALEKTTSTDLRNSIAELAVQLQQSTAEHDKMKQRLASTISDRDAIAAALAAALADVKTKTAAAASDKAEVDAKLADAYKLIDADRQKVQTLLGDIAALESLRDDLKQKLGVSQADADAAKKLTSEDELQIELLNRQMTVMRDQLAKLVTALDASEAKAKAGEVQIIDLGKRLNEALASKVEELARYRSEFFGRLKEVLGNRQDVQVVGDRFIFQSEVLFATGSSDIGEDGQRQLAAFADTLKNIAARIPTNIDWLLRVDGHTDKHPYHGGLGTNWELSTARAIAVVKFLIDQGIPPNRLVAAGFAEFRPLAEGDSDDILRRNRRIELKLDQR
jgi:chemotaxis protein MotB